MINDEESRKIRHVRGVASAPDAAETPLQATEHVPSGEGKRARSHKSSKKYPAWKRYILFGLLGLLVLGLGVGLKFYFDVIHPETLFQGGKGTAAFAKDGEKQLRSQADASFMKDRVNILVLGVDQSVERPGWGSYRTDTMILVTIDFTTNDVDMISIPRDSYVKIIDAKGKKQGKGKINSAYSVGGGLDEEGYEYAMNTVSYLFGGIPINYYLGFDMDVVKDVVNAMGGLDFNVDTEVDVDGYVLHPGMQHLDGLGVLQYARQRKGSSDIARVERQQKVIMAIFQQLKSSGQVPRIPEIYQAVEQNIQTNLSVRQISALALLALNMDTSQLERHMVSGDFLDLSSGSYWGVNTKALKELIQEVFGVEVTIDDEISIESVKASVEEETVNPIEEELSAAGRAVDRGQSLMEAYGSYLEANSRERLQQAIDLVQDAIETQDEDHLNSSTKELKAYCDAVEESLQQAGLLETEG